MPSFIQLTQEMITLVDDNMFEYLNQWKWHYHQGYARRNTKINGKRKIISIHQIVMNTPDGFDTDHINGNKLDNRKENLRICTHEENTQNKNLSRDNISGYKGVNKRKKNGKWRARIIYKGKEISLGEYFFIEDAAKAYDIAAIEYFREFAKLNFDISLYTANK